jgi:hypothetical protein
MQDERMVTLPSPLSSDELSLSQVPLPEATWPEIVAFSHTFDGYGYWGSNAECTKVANKRRQETLAKVRTCLFFEQRRWNDSGNAPDPNAMDYIRDLIREIRKRVTGKAAWVVQNSLVVALIKVDAKVAKRYIKRWPMTLQKRITGETSFSLVAAIQPLTDLEHNSQTQPF